MQRLILFNVFLLITSFSFAQSLEIINHLDGDANVSGDTVLRYFGNDPGDDHHIYLKVKNTSSGAIDVMVKRYELDVTTGTNNYFCWYVCYGNQPAGAAPLFPDPVPGTHYINIPANGTATQELQAHHLPETLIGLEKYRYVAFDANNPTDSVYVDLFFNIGTTGIETIDEVSVQLYPNPADNLLNIQIGELSGNAIFQITDVTGKTVGNHNIRSGQNQISVSGLDAGLYAYLVLDSNGNARKTGRFIVK